MREIWLAAHVAFATAALYPSAAEANCFSPIAVPGDLVRVVPEGGEAIVPFVTTMPEGRAFETASLELRRAPPGSSVEVLESSDQRFEAVVRVPRPGEHEGEQVRYVWKCTEVNEDVPPCALEFERVFLLAEGGVPAPGIVAPEHVVARVGEDVSFSVAAEGSSSALWASEALGEGGDCSWLARGEPGGGEGGDMDAQPRSVQFRGVAPASAAGSTCVVWGHVEDRSFSSASTTLVIVPRLPRERPEAEADLEGAGCACATTAGAPAGPDARALAILAALCLAFRRQTRARTRSLRSRD